MNHDPEHFRIKSLVRDHDAMLLIGLSIALGLLLAGALALMTETQWDNLVQRANVLWAAALVVAPTLLAIWSRYKLRSRAVEAAGNASQPAVHTEQTVNTPANTEPASVVRARAADPILPRGAGD